MNVDDYGCMLNKGAGIEADLTVSIIGSGSGSSADPSFDGRGFYIAAAGGAAPALPRTARDGMTTPAAPLRTPRREKTSEKTIMFPGIHTIFL